MARVLIIGLDGFEPSLAERWMDAGRLPHLAALRKRGTFLPLASTKPPVTFPAWTTCVTGVSPGRHGIFDFTETIPGQYAIRFVNATFCKAPTLWQVLSEAGKRVCVLGVPGTYPAQPVNGVLVSGFDSPVATAVGRASVYPPERFDEVKDWRFADVQESHIGPGWHDRALAALLRKVDDQGAIACRLLAQEPWDFFMAVFGASDTVSHHFWLFHDGDSPRYRPGSQDAIAQVYGRLDTAVGRLAEAAGGDALIAVVSDHGFRGAGTGVVHLNNWLAERGYLRFRRGGASPLKQAALRWTPVRWRGAIFRRFEQAATRAESQSRFGGIDWAFTRAWSEELNYFPSIRLNLSGREPEGRVGPEDYDRLVGDLCAELESWEAVAHAWPRADVYEGPYVERAPDIVIELAAEGGYAHSCLRSRGGPAFRRLGAGEAFGGKERGTSGVHHDPGTLILSEAAASTSASLLDIAPTVLARLGVAGPPMEGVSLIGNAPAATHAAISRQVEERPYSDAEEREVAARLRALGYLE